MRHAERLTLPRLLAPALALCLLAAPARARINVVTLPARDSVQLTVYNSADLTLVRESRRLTFKKGLNRLEFSWANTLIDPTSVELRAVERADAIEVLDVSFPPRAANTLEWRIQSETAGDVAVEIHYFTSGIGWTADYAAELEPNEKLMGLAGHVRVQNGSGEDYENAQVRVVVGVIRLVEQIVDLARQRSEEQLGKKPAATTTALRSNLALGRDTYARFRGAVGGRAGGLAAAGEEDELRRKEIRKEELSEYFLYTVEGRDTIPNGWAKRLPSLAAAGVPVVGYYRYEAERTGGNVVRYYRFTNAAPSRLGKEPLPDGAVKAFRLTGPERLYEYAGGARMKYAPLDETVELEMGPDRQVLVKPALMNWEKTDVRFDTRGEVKGWTTRETWEFELRNSRQTDIVLDLRRNFAGDWSLATAAPYEKMDAGKVRFLAPLKARETKRFGYELTTRHGINATR